MPDAPKYFGFKNWKKYQSYKSVNPSWIKLHKKLLRCRDFMEQSEVRRWRLIGLILMACEHDNRILYDTCWLHKELNCKGPLDFAGLFSSNMLEWLDGFTPPDEDEDEDEDKDKEKEKEREVADEVPSDRKPSAAQLVFINAWNSAPFRTARAMTGKRLASYKARMNDADFAEHWQEAIERASHSNFCKGNNERGWIADIEWFLRPDTMTRILEGKYDNPKTEEDRLASAAAKDVLKAMGLPQG